MKKKKQNAVDVLCVVGSKHTCEAHRNSVVSSTKHKNHIRETGIQSHCRKILVNKTLCFPYEHQLLHEQFSELPYFFL